MASIFDGEAVRFDIPAGFRVGNYEILDRLGSGWTAETYLCRELPTGIRRAFKIYDQFDDRQAILNLKLVAHYADVLERLGDIAILPRYHHMGHLFLWNHDGLGHHYMIQEWIERGPTPLSACSREQVSAFLAKVKSVHARGLALGDLEPDNLVVTPSGAIRMVDCDYGRPGRDNTNIEGDVRALGRLFKSLGFKDLWQAPR